MFALTRIPTRTFGVLMSAEPALGALSGLAFLHERLSLIQWAAIASIMAASAGSAATSGPAAPTIKDWNRDTLAGGASRSADESHGEIQDRRAGQGHAVVRNFGCAW